VLVGLKNNNNNIQESTGHWSSSHNEKAQHTQSNNTAKVKQDFAVTQTCSFVNMSTERMCWYVKPLTYSVGLMLCIGTTASFATSLGSAAAAAAAAWGETPGRPTRAVSDTIPAETQKNKKKQMSYVETTLY